MKKQLVVLSATAALLTTGLLGATTNVEAKAVELKATHMIMTERETGKEIAEHMDDFTRQLLEWEAQGIDPNHSAALEKMLAAIEASIDNQFFASVHIDREKRKLGTLVFSFTQEPSIELQQQLTQLKDEHTELELRVVKYTEAELFTKQNEIHQKWDQLAKEGIQITVVGSDIIENLVSVGIYPYSEAHASRLSDLFGEMIKVVEEPPASTLDMQVTSAGSSALEADLSRDLVAEVTTQQEEATAVKQGLFQKLLNWVKGIFTFSK